MQRKVLYHWVESFQKGRTSVVDKDRSGRPTTLRTADSFQRVNDLVQEERRVAVSYKADKLDISCGSAYSVIYEDLSIIEFVQGGCHISLWMSINGHAWKRACNFCRDTMKKARLSFNGLLQAMQHRCTTMNLQADVKTWSGSTRHHPRPQEILKCAFCRQSDVDAVLGLQWAQGPSSSTARIVDRMSLAHTAVQCLERSLNPLFTVKAEECRQMELYRIMTTLDLIRQKRPLKRFENRNSSFSPQLNIHSTSPFI
jgi:hypothetical protein